MLVKTRALIALTMLLPVMQLAGCATEQSATEQRAISVSNQQQPIELRRLSFLPPSGKGWEGWKDDTSPLRRKCRQSSRRNPGPLTP